MLLTSEALIASTLATYTRWQISGSIELNGMLLYTL